VSGLRRPTPARQVVELTRHLAEAYPSIPLREVSRVVGEAVAATTGPDGNFAGTREGIPALIEVIELVAREDLDVVESGGTRHGFTPTPVAAAPRATRPNGRRRGVG
jgi:hypothetical protein